jgi:hypothetical protein
MTVFARKSPSTVVFAANTPSKTAVRAECPSKTVLEAEGLYKRFGGLAAISGVTMDVR